nr:MAG TPA: Major capsid protein [Microviridae sp.]
MSTRKIFGATPVQLPNRSGFDLSHENMLTLKCGQLVPVMTDLLIPGDRVSVGSAFEIQLPPMATDFYGRVRFKMEAFFVPCRLLYGGWQKFMTSPTGNNAPSSISVGSTLPFCVVPAENASILARASLADYLGYKGTINTRQRINNILRFMAYHKIYDDWYRDSRIQKPVFDEVVPANTSAGAMSVANLPYRGVNGDSFTYGTATKFADGVDLFSLRQRNWARDYFTNATPLPQAGVGASLSFDVANDSGSFTIASLRAANSLQQWLERNNIAGNRYADQIKAHFGVMPSDAVTQRAIYLGSSSSLIYNHSVYQTNNAGDVVGDGSPNPFTSVGSKYSAPIGSDKSSLVGDFSVTEFGYLMVIGSIVPDAVYATGVNRDFFRLQIGDFAFPLLQGVGDQPIYKAELANVGVDGNTMDAMETFGYTQRFAEYKFMEDEVHGGLCDGQSLSAFALKRSFGTLPNTALGASFLEIPVTYLDDVSASASSLPSTYGAWADIFFQYRKTSVLSAYTIPTLGDPHNTHIDTVPSGGRRL